ncbi:hypothetical protein [Kandleria sp.]|uniref:hypothetical protein n=1 Tax=Kandleria sp. TaxID=2774291 RepID=UPI001B43DB9C|nr:hypothetical protein [Kandleria sp.]MBP3275663.1 hypothetical protein [Kandleria sp.]
MWNDIKSLLINELTGLKLRNDLLIPVGTAIVVVIYLLNGKTNNTLIIMLLPHYFGAMWGMILSATAFNNEKENNMLDTIVLSGISEYSIYLGKILSPWLLACILDFIIMILIKLGFLMRYGMSIHYSLIDFILPILISYFIVSMTLNVHILTNNDKQALFITFIIVGVLFYLAFRLFLLLNFSLNLYMIIVGMLLSMITTFISLSLIRHISYFIKTRQ